MKKIFSLIYLILLFLAMVLSRPTGAQAISIQILMDPASGAKVGDKVKITYRVENDDPNAARVLLRIYSPDNLENEAMYSTKASQDAPPVNAGMGWEYIWDTKASQSEPGNHRVDVVITTRDETEVLMAQSAPLYNLASATSSAQPKPSSSVSDPTGIPGELSPPPGGPAESLLPGNPEDWGLQTIFEIINRILTFVSLIAGVLAVFLIVWHGFVYFQAFGSEEKVEGAKKAIIYTLSGLALIILSKLFVAWLVEFFK